VQEGNDGEGDRERDRVQCQIRDAAFERRFEYVSKDRFADPAECQRRHRDPQLRSGNVRVEVVEQFQKTCGAATAARHQHLDSRPSHADESKFRSDKETIGKDE